MCACSSIVCRAVIFARTARGGAGTATLRPLAGPGGSVGIGSDLSIAFVGRANARSSFAALLSSYFTCVIFSACVLDRLVAVEVPDTRPWFEGGGAGGSLAIARRACKWSQLFLLCFCLLYIAFLHVFLTQMIHSIRSPSSLFFSIPFCHTAQHLLTPPIPIVPLATDPPAPNKTVSTLYFVSLSCWSVRLGV